MCYPKPGPRCSGHARQALDNALADVETALDAGDHDAYIRAREDVDAAQDAYDRTSEGIASLRADGEDELADQYTKERAEAVAAYKRSVEPPAPTEPVAPEEQRRLVREQKEREKAAKAAAIAARYASMTDAEVRHVRATLDRDDPNSVAASFDIHAELTRRRAEVTPAFDRFSKEDSSGRTDIEYDQHGALRTDEDLRAVMEDRDQPDEGYDDNEIRTRRALAERALHTRAQRTFDRNGIADVIEGRTWVQPKTFAARYYLARPAVLAGLVETEGSRDEFDGGELSKTESGHLREKFADSYLDSEGRLYTRDMPPEYKERLSDAVSALLATVRATDNALSDTTGLQRDQVFNR